jgi:hypothetical protein
MPAVRQVCLMRAVRRVIYAAHRGRRTVPVRLTLAVAAVPRAARVSLGYVSRIQNTITVTIIAAAVTGKGIINCVPATAAVIRPRQSKVTVREAAVPTEYVPVIMQRPVQRRVTMPAIREPRLVRRAAAAKAAVRPARVLTAPADAATAVVKERFARQIQNMITVHIIVKAVTGNVPISSAPVTAAVIRIR